MHKIAVMGFGTVGGGVYEALQINKQEIESRLGTGVEIAHILDLRTFEGHPLADKVTKDFDAILADDSVEVIAETMGGSHPAYDFSKRALEAGKSVVTSNKECVEKYGAELEKIAREHGVSYLYEASAGGGIPCVHTLKNCLAWGQIKRVAGILNGTTNFILTKMMADKLSFDEALKMAQQLGFAEADPTADVAGYDAARKICILGGIAWDSYIGFNDMPLIEGITSVTYDDLVAADNAGYAIKLIAMAINNDKGLALSVCPMLVHKEHIFASVSGSYNAVSILGTTADEIVLYGRGAGSLPTANAVVSDVLEAIAQKPIPAVRSGKVRLLGKDDAKFDTFTLTTGKEYRIFG